MHISHTRCRRYTPQHSWSLQIPWNIGHTLDIWWQSVTILWKMHYAGLQVTLGITTGNQWRNNDNITTRHAHYACSDSDTNNLESSYSSTSGLSEWVGFNIPSKNYRSFWRRVFPVYHLHRYWQPNKNNKEREHTNKDKNNATQEVALVNMNISTHNCKCGILSQDL